MSSMYDKLGDLLKDALEKGEIPTAKNAKTIDNEQNKTETISQSTDNAEKEQNESVKQNNAHTQNTKNANSEKIKKNIRYKKKSFVFHTKTNTRQGKVLHGSETENVRPFILLPENIQNAYNLLGVSSSATDREIRNAYHEKLKLFHPDSNSDNETIQKIAHKKTEEIVEAYNLISSYKKNII